MPFKETCPVEERIALFVEYETGVFTIAELCRRHGISRETVYGWKRPRDSGEARGDEQRSHAVGRSPHTTSGWSAERSIAARRRFPPFGPQKIKPWQGRARRQVA